MKKLIGISTMLMAQTAWADDIRDVRPPVHLPPNYAFWFIVTGLILIMTMVLLVRYFLRRFYKHRHIQAVTQSQYPWQVAYEKLEQLKRENLPAQRRIKEYYIRLSDIIRHYIEERFNVRAPEMTTEEFLFSLQGSRNLTVSQKEFLKEFLNHCDMVKFAKYSATQGEMAKSFQLAWEFVDATKQTLP